MGNILNIIMDIISGLLLNIFCIHFYYVLLNEKIEWEKIKVFTILIFMTVIGILLNIYCNKPFKFILSFAVLTAAAYFISNKNISKALLLTILFELTIFISELIIVIFLPFFNNINNNEIISIFSNLVVCFVGSIIIKTKIPNKLFELYINITEPLRKREAINYSLIIIFILMFSTIESYMKLPILMILIINIIIAFIFISIIIRFINTKNNYQLISDKYQTSISSLKEYESMIDKYRVNNHENKNELMTIRNMIKAKDKNTIEYIDKLVDNKVKDNERIMYKTSKIPEGGLRATIYSKLTLMDKYKIKYTLDIANDVRTTDLINLGDDLILNICKILGVFLDNAIDEVKKLRKKNIDIEFYVMDGYLNIDITNNFKGNLDINRLGIKNYTTKGEGHGYGLALVNKIIYENSKFLANEKSINGDRFTQTLKIKM